MANIQEKDERKESFNVFQAEKIYFRRIPYAFAFGMLLTESEIVLRSGINGSLRVYEFN